MAFTLKKHTSNQLESARLNDVNDNWGDIENAVNVLDSGAVIGRGTLANNTDLNTVKTNGAYRLSSANTYTNMPDGVTSGILIVFAPASSQAVQRLVSLSASYERYATSTQWSSWR